MSFDGGCCSMHTGPLERQVYERAALVLSSSEGYARGSASLASLGDKVKTFPFGIDLRPFLEPNVQTLTYAVELRERHGTPLWLMVGRLVYYKGLFTAVDALRKVPGKLMIVGARTPGGRPEKARCAQGRGRSHRVGGQPGRRRAAGAYRAATALWFPSSNRAEAFGLVQVEAMASGCPVINTYIPDSGVPAVSVDSVSGLSVPVDDPEELADASRCLLQNHPLRTRLARGARERAIAEFDQRVMATRSLALYEEALGRATHQPPASSDMRRAII